MHRCSIRSLKLSFTSQKTRRVFSLPMVMWLGSIRASAAGAGYILKQHSNRSFWMSLMQCESPSDSENNPWCSPFKLSPQAGLPCLRRKLWRLLKSWLLMIASKNAHCFCKVISQSVFHKRSGQIDLMKYGIVDVILWKEVFKSVFLFWSLTICMRHFEKNILSFKVVLMNILEGLLASRISSYGV